MSTTEKYNLTIAVATALTGMLVGLMTLSWNASKMNANLGEIGRRQDNVIKVMNSHIKESAERHKADPVISEKISKNEESLKELKVDLGKLSQKQNFIKYDIKNYIDESAMAIIKAIK